MKLKDKISMCLRNLYKRKVRTLLTMIGVIVGTCAIMITVSLGIGMQMQQEAALAQMGDLTIISIYGYGISADATQLDDDFLDLLKQQEHVAALTPGLAPDWGSIKITSGKYEYSGSLYGVYTEDLEKLGYGLTEGSYDNPDKYTIYFGSNSLYDFMDTKKKNGNNMIYPGMGKDPYVSVDDKFEITIQVPEDYKRKVPNFKVEIGGVMAEDWSKNPNSSYSTFINIDFMKELIAAYKKANNIKFDANAPYKYESVMVKCDDMNNVAEVEEFIQSFGFQTNSMESIRKPLQEQAQKQQLTLGALGAVSLFVAAIGIMNTMIMSIYERTREIGVMKVLGCKISDIRQTFLMEAGTIGFLGGVIGVAVSMGVSFAINHFASGASGDIYDVIYGGATATSSVIPLWLIFASLFFATMVGLVSGIYPANRAVKISALAAIRQD